jgi:enoyl-CoA hydratase
MARVSPADTAPEAPSDQVLVESREDEVLVLTLNRPHKRNALSLELCERITESVTLATSAATATAGSRSARAIVVTGAGSSFCAGADLDEVYGEQFLAALQAMIRAITRAPVPVVAAVNGPAIGGGTQLALACDLRVATDRAVFAIPTARNGLAVDPWTIRRLGDIVGGGHARGILLAAESLDLPAALASGLVQREGDLGAATALARDLAQLAPLSLAYAKRVLNHPELPEDDASLQADFHACFASEDAAEAGDARLQRRPPVFRGR